MTHNDHKPAMEHRKQRYIAYSATCVIRSSRNTSATTTNTKTAQERGYAKTPKISKTRGKTQKTKLKEKGLNNGQKSNLIIIKRLILEK